MPTAPQLKTKTDECCAICGTNDWKPVFKVPFPDASKSGRVGYRLDEQVEVPTWTIARCKSCTVETVYPRPSIQQIERYYASQTEPNDYEQQYYVHVPETKLRGFDDFASRITALNKKPGRLLEIGCAAGWLLDRARRQGWEVQGLEASPKFHSFATGELKLPVTLGTIASASPEQLGTFDTIMMFDVLEHLHDPVSDLTKIRKLLRPGGRLVVATCAIDSFFAKFYGLDWRQLVVSHTFYWTRQSLALAFKRAGLTIDSISEPRYWHPDKKIEQRLYMKELAKLSARFFLRATYCQVTEKLPLAKKLPEILTAGRIDHNELVYKIGDQPVLNDVLLVVATPE